MPYINKTLSENESIISFNKFHWFYLVSQVIGFIVFAVLSLVFGFNDDGTGYGYLFSAVAGFMVLLYLLVFFIRLIHYWTTEQVLTNKRVFIKTGLIRRDTDELSREKVETISIKQGIIGRLLNYGDIEFTGTGGIKLSFHFVKDPTEVKKQYE